MKTMWKVVVAAACLAIVLSGCGGGGGGAALTRYSLWITGPSSSRTYQIDNPAVNLSGGSFVPEGAECTGNLVPCPTVTRSLGVMRPTVYRGRLFPPRLPDPG